MLSIALVEPEIAQNTGSIARLCAATGMQLHLVGRLGFTLDAASLRRAGLDYWNDVCVGVHRDFESFVEHVASRPLYLYSARGTAIYTQAKHGQDDVLVFGSESVGLAPRIIDAYPDRTLRLPVRAGVRSLNLAAVVHVAAYHALAQLGFPGVE